MENKEGHIEWRVCPSSSFFLKKRISNLFKHPLKEGADHPFFHRLDSSEWNRSNTGDTIAITGCCVPGRDEKISGVFMKLGKKRFEGQWGLPRKSLPPSMCGDGGDGSYGYVFTFPLPHKTSSLFFYAVMESGRVHKFLGRKIKVRRFFFWRKVLASWLRSLISYWLKIKLSTVLQVPGGSKGKILLVAHVMNRTGAPILFLHLARGLKAKGYTVLCLSLQRRNSLETDLHQSGIPLLAAPEFRYIETGMFDLFSSFEVVVANTVATAGAVEGFTRTGLPVIWWIQDGYCGLQVLKGLKERKDAYGHADTIVFPTMTTGSLYSEINDRHFEIIPNGIPDPAISACVQKSGGRPAIRLEKDRFVFSIMGTVCERKGQDILIEAVKLLPPELNQKAVFQIAGNCADVVFKAYCTKKIGDLTNIRWLPECSPEKSLEIIAGSDVLIVASRDEALPVVIQEAMALGKGIISSRAGGVADCMSDGHDCLLIPVNDARSLSNAIQRCLLDSSLIANLGIKARETYEKLHRAELMVERFESLLQAAKTRGS